MPKAYKTGSFTTPSVPSDSSDPGNSWGNDKRAADSKQRAKPLQTTESAPDEEMQQVSNLSSAVSQAIHQNVSRGPSGDVYYRGACFAVSERQRSASPSSRNYQPCDLSPLKGKWALTCSITRWLHPVTRIRFISHQEWHHRERPLQPVDPRGSDVIDLGRTPRLAGLRVCCGADEAAAARTELLSTGTDWFTRCHEHLTPGQFHLEESAYLWLHF